MCIDCDDEETWYAPVCLIRAYPKNKETDPARWLEHYDYQRGYYEVVENSSDINVNDCSYTIYGGAALRTYSQPMFTFKDIGTYVCRACEVPEENPYPDHHPLPRRSATRGCQCGNVAYAARDCESHPLPSIDSRWIRLNQPGADNCSFCKKELQQESWDARFRYYCNEKCNEEYRVAYAKRLKELGITER